MTPCDPFLERMEPLYSQLLREVEAVEPARLLVKGSSCYGGHVATRPIGLSYESPGRSPG